MRARPWLLASLGLNLFLAVSWWVAREPLEDSAVVIPAYHPELDVKTNIIVRHENFTWDQIESADYATLIKNLRALGCPEQTIRDIVITDVDREFDRRRATEVVAPRLPMVESRAGRRPRLGRRHPAPHPRNRARPPPHRPPRPGLADPQRICRRLPRRN